MVYSLGVGKNASELDGGAFAWKKKAKRNEGMKRYAEQYAESERTTIISTGGLTFTSNKEEPHSMEKGGVCIGTFPLSDNASE